MTRELVNPGTSVGWHSRQLDEEARVRRTGLVTVLVDDVAQPDGGRWVVVWRPSSGSGSF